MQAVRTEAPERNTSAAPAAQTSPAVTEPSQQPAAAGFQGDAQQSVPTVSAETPQPSAPASAPVTGSQAAASPAPEAPADTQSALVLTPLEETVAGAPAAKRTAYPTFDCSGSRNYAEELICNSDELSAFDNQMVAAYAAKLKNSDNAEATKKQQQEWLSYRDRCANAACIRERDQRRLQELQQ